MLNLSDKELDQLSREAAEQYEPDEEISSWEKLEQQLDGENDDKPPAAQPRFRARPLGYGALLLLLAGSSYFLLKSGNDSKHSTLKNQVSTETNKQSGNKENNPAQKQTVNADNKNEPVSATSTNEVTKETANSKKDAAIDNSNTAANVDKANGAAPDNKLNDRKNSGNNQNNIAKNKDNNKISNKTSNNKNGLNDAAVIGIAGINNNKTGHGKINNKNKKPVPRKNKNVADVADVNSSALLLTESKKSSGKNNIAAIDQTEKPKYAGLPGLILSNNMGADISDSSLRKVVSNADNNQPAAKSQSLHINRSLAIGIMIAPDVTKVGSASSNKLSPNFGITIGYSFAPRWSINTGIIYTKKNYASYGKDFHWSYSPNTEIDYADGYCNMWEIPLTLRYNFASKTKNNFFINSGLSSYLMKHESYTISAHSSNPPPYGTVYWEKSLSADSHNKYLFSVFSLSAGMEHRFNKNFSLQVEPFIKIPLTGVGIGSLQLNSYGLSFSLRYSPVLSKSRH